MHHNVQVVGAGWQGEPLSYRADCSCGFVSEWSNDPESAEKARQDHETAELGECAECGHLHYIGFGVYAPCPLPECDCLGQDEHGRPVRSA